jgi:hypothetical protein
VSDAERTAFNDLDWDADELAEEEWRLFVAQRLTADLADPRQDIYEHLGPSPR